MKRDVSVSQAPTEAEVRKLRAAYSTRVGQLPEAVVALCDSWLAQRDRIAALETAFDLRAELHNKDRERLAAQRDVVALLKQTLWEIYVTTGSDPDGDSKWHCPPEDAARFTLMAVQELRKDYDEC